MSGHPAVDGSEEPSLSILSPDGTDPRDRSLSGTVGGGTTSYEESGVLRTQSHRAGRHAVGLLLCAVVLVTPFLLLHGGPDASATVGAARPATGPSLAAGVARPVAPPPPATSARPVAIEAAPVRNVEATTTVHPTTTVPPTNTTTVPPTTTTTVPPTTTTAPPLAGSHVATSGIVTYYDHPAGHCASPWLPFGTVVRVVNPANGASVTCVVDDREADTARSIDLATSTFAEIAPLGQGVVDARLTW